MRLIILLHIVFFTVLLNSCRDWEAYYDYPETSDQNVWDALKNDAEVSKFVQVVLDAKLDSLFQTDDAYTIFAPDNKAFDDYLSEHQIDEVLLKYHISVQLLQSNTFNEKDRIRTFNDKLALVSKSGDEILFDSSNVTFESPLYSNGKYYILSRVAKPKMNLYEYLTANNAMFKKYIDDQDSLILDLEESIPIGFDEFGNTIYDTVAYFYNEFDDQYFEIREELRFQTATMVFPLSEQYNAGLTEMAKVIGGSYVDYNDIPVVWQQEILIPHLIDLGVFKNKLEPEDFFVNNNNGYSRLMNILGDSVIIGYQPTNKTICSNGYVYDYSNFTVPDSLYNTAARFEMEKLVFKSGQKFFWNDDVNLISEMQTNPIGSYNGSASNDSIVRVSFINNPTGRYELEFNSVFLFPKKYIMKVRTKMDIGGIFKIYVDGEPAYNMKDGAKIYQFDWHRYQDYYGYIRNSLDTDWYVPEGQYNYFDMFVDNIDEFKKPKIKIEYVGPGEMDNNGLLIDYIEFIPIN